MTVGECMILVVSRTESAGRELKELIEFMDTPRVGIAAPGEWRDKLGNCKLEALFVGSDLSDEEIDELLGDIGQLDPNVPIVMMNDGSEMLSDTDAL